MNRPFLFLSGEFRVSMPTVFERDNWQHTMSPSRLAWSPSFMLTSERAGRLFREQLQSEDLRGIIHYANCEDDERERHNLETIVTANVPCWPRPWALLRLLDRHEVLQNCIKLGVGADVRRYFLRDGEWCPLDFPVVVKTGNAHRGEGKFLIRNADDWGAVPEWDGVATVEPFIEGVSTRILVIGERHWVARYDNKDSWIRNSAGAEVSRYDGAVPDSALEEAHHLMLSFGIDVAGVDYVVDRDGRWRFLEINAYPGLDVFDDEVEWARAFLRSRMDIVEDAARNGVSF